MSETMQRDAAVGAKRLSADTAGLMSRFQSLGDNCEFGYVQGHFGSPAIDLLRWAGISCSGVTKGLENDFDGLFQIENIRPQGAKGVIDTKYDIIFHTQFKIGPGANGEMAFVDADFESMHRKEAARMAFLVRKFLDDLASGERIYIFKREAAVSSEEMRSLHLALNQRKPQKLLVVSPASPDLAADDVRLISPGLKVAGIARFARPNRTDLADYDGWEVICRKAALGLWQ